MNPSCDLSCGAVCICVLQRLSWTGSLHGHCVQSRAAVPCEGFVSSLVECGGLWMLLLLLLLFLVLVPTNLYRQILFLNCIHMYSPYP